MSNGEICLSMVPGQSSSSCEVQDEKLPNSSIKPKGILWQDKKFPIIYKVPHRLRYANEKPYEPSVISIGPYHHGKEHLKEMEDIKKSFFDTNAGERREYLQAAIREDVERVRKWYVQINGLSSEQFIEMVVLDGFFIVQLFRGKLPEFVSRQRYIQAEIRYDLLLLENQLPFFVLHKFHEIMTQNEETPKEFTDLALVYFKYLIGETKSSECLTPKENIKHLLGLIHDTPRWHPSIGTEQEDKERNDRSKKAKRGKFIRCARELEEAGISFEKRDEKKDKCRALDIEFKRNCRKPKLRIPQFWVGDHTELLLRNLIAFEQSFPRNEPTYVYDYVYFLDQLINSEKDVQLLCNSDIIQNWLGDYEAIAKVFNRLLDYTYLSDGFYYSGIFEQINDHCDNRWNKHMANLRGTYFNSPWALLSFLAALILLFLTFAQTMIALLTIDCRYCVVLFIVFGVLLVVIGVFLYLCLG